MNIILTYFAIKYKGNWDKIYQALENKEKVELPELNKLEQEIKDKGWNLITILDMDYPLQLKEAYKPPFVLWIAGDRKLLDNKMLVVTGDFNDDTSQKRLEKVMPEIEAAHTVISVGTSEIDKSVNELSTKGNVVVLSQGITKDMVEHESDLFITEYPPKTNQTKETKHKANRISAALGSSLILMSSNKGGEILNLVTNFLNLGNEIYCFPGDGSDNDGNSQLIKQGAKLITDIKDLSN